MEIIIERSPDRIDPKTPEILNSEIEGAVKTTPFQLHTPFQGGPNRRSSGKIILFMWTAAVLDLLIILAASIVAVVILSWIGKSEMMTTLKWIFAKAHANKTFFRF